MLIKRLLLFLPLGLILLLAQSFFWVPTYDKQGVGNPLRLTKYIDGSGGDAQILNPILSADTTSSSINELVFDGLLDLDDDLKYRPRLATGWSQYEVAYLLLQPGYSNNGFSPEKPESWIGWLRQNLGENSQWIGNIKDIVVVPGEVVEGTVMSPAFDSEGNPVMKNGQPKMEPVKYTLRLPDRLKFTLISIDQDFFQPIRELLGEKYFSRFPINDFIKADDPAQFPRLKNHIPDILPVIEENPIIVFDLRRGVRFHDSHEMDSGDVLFTYKSIMDVRNASPRRSDYEPVKSAEVMGPWKIKFTYKRLFSPAINAWMMGILPEHLLNKEALKKEARSKGLSDDQIEKFSFRESSFHRNPVGTGPFIFKEWQGDELIRLARNTDYWGGPPEYEEYIMRIIPDVLTQEMEFYAGAVDNYAVQPHQVARLKKDEKYQSFSSVGYSYSYIGYNLRNPLFASREVRTALGMAIDIEEIIKYVLYDEGERITGPYAKITDWYDHDVKPIRYNPVGALKILNGLGWKKNADGYLEKNGKIFEFNLITNAGNPIRKNIMTIVQNKWEKLGVKVNTQLFEWAVFLKDFVNTGHFDALVLGWSMGIDPDQFQIWHSSQTGPRQLNFVGYKDPEVDDLLIKIRKEYDRDKQIQMTQKLHQKIAVDQPYTFLFVRKATHLLDKKIVIVEREQDGSEKYVKIYPVKGGNIRYYFNKWRKLSDSPEIFLGME